MIGTTFGPYRVESRLGGGGMGEVFTARDPEHGNRRVALKVLPDALSGDAQYRARFRREAELAARLSDPHIATIHRYGEIDGRLFLDMELVDGRDLAAAVAQGPLAPAAAVEIIEQIAGALDTAHAGGLVHRDIKASNVLVAGGDNGRPPHAVLIDFGIATATDPGSATALTRTGAVIGTLAYMAPERFQGEPAGPPADVYSLACLLHELLTVDEGKAISRIDLRAARPLGPPVPQPDVNELWPLTVFELSGRKVVVTGSDVMTADPLVFVVRDVVTLDVVGRGQIIEAVADLDGAAVALSGLGAQIRVADLASGNLIREIPAAADALAILELAGRLVAVTGAGSGEIALYDVATGTRIGAPLIGHQATVTSLQTIRLGDRPVLVSAAQDNAIRVWDLAARAHG